MIGRFFGGVLVLAAGVAACAPEEADVHAEHGHEPAGDPIGVAREGLSLSALASMVGCTTAGTEGISAQLVDEMLCLSEGRLVRFEHPSIRLTSSRVHPYLSPAGRDMILRVAARTTVELNSTLRTIAEQYVLYDGCSVAAQPGRSNHETGRAIDVDNWSSIGSILVSEGFSHPLPDSDPVHYEAPGDDLRNLSVLSFQRLWNVNHPEDRIDEDGVSGPQTLGRLGMSPAEGFPLGGTCGACTPSAEVCDGADNDCDGAVDEDDVCAPPPPPPPPPDAGVPDAGPAPDSGAAFDAGPRRDAAPPPAPDAGPPGGDAAPAGTRVLADDGCSCEAAGARRGSRSDWRGWLVLAAVAALAVRRRRRSTRVHRD